MIYKYDLKIFVTVFYWFDAFYPHFFKCRASIYFTKIQSNSEQNAQKVS